MKRRTLLRQLGGAGAAAALAGCVADRPGSDDQSSDPEGDDQPAAADDNESSGGNQTDDADATAGTSSPELTGTDITTNSAKGDSTDEAAVTFGDGTVTVDGTITAPTPCHEAEVKTSEYSESADEFRVTVTTRSVEKDRICSQVITGLEYTLEASFDGGTPINVVVSHETASEGTKTVAEDSRR